VDLDPLDHEDRAIIKELLQTHQQLTGSQQAMRLLTNWANSQGQFVKVIPRDYKAALEKQKQDRHPQAS
jgi:glutamate synthase (NADPH/NADH) large chain